MRTGAQSYLTVCWQAFPKGLTDEIRDRLKQDGSPPAKDLFDKFRVFLLSELNSKYWADFLQR